VSKPRGVAPYSFSTVAIEVDPVTEQTSLPSRSSGPGDAVVVGGDQQLLAGHVVGPGLTDDLRRSSVIE
jgi:hypothetical protein